MKNSGPVILFFNNVQQTLFSILHVCSDILDAVLIIADSAKQRKNMEDAKFIQLHPVRNLADEDQRFMDMQMGYDPDYTDELPFGDTPGGVEFYDDDDQPFGLGEDEK